MENKYKILNSTRLVIEMLLTHGVILLSYLNGNRDFFNVIMLYWWLTVTETVIAYVKIYLSKKEKLQNILLLALNSLGFSGFHLFFLILLAPALAGTSGNGLQSDLFINRISDWMFLLSALAIALSSVVDLIWQVLVVKSEISVNTNLVKVYAKIYIMQAIIIIGVIVSSLLQSNLIAMVFIILTAVFDFVGRMRVNAVFK